MKGIHSLAVVLEEVRAERDLQLRHLESIDTKAGIVLGFSGAIVALGQASSPGPLDAGRAFAVAAGLISLWTFWPRRYWSVDLRPFRDRYLSAEPEFTRLRLVDTQIDMAERMALILKKKAFRLKLAMAFLASSVASTSAAFVLH